MTNREFLTAISANETIPADIREHATNEIAKLDAANEKRKNKPSKTAVENAPIVANILEVLTHDAQTAADIAAQVGISTQKASSLLRQLGTAGQVVVSEIKVPKKGTCKGYALPVADEATDAPDAE